MENSIDLLHEIKTFKEEEGTLRDIAFHKIFKMFEPLIYTQLKKLTCKTPEDKLKAVQFIRIQLFEILNERFAKKDKEGNLIKDKHGNVKTFDKNRLKIGAPKQMTKYISISLNSRVNNDHFKFYAADSHCIKGIYVTQFRFRNAKKRFMQKFHKEPELSYGSEDLKEFTRIYDNKISPKKQNEVLMIAANLNNPIESFEKKLPFGKSKNDNGFRLMDVLQATNENAEEECIAQKNREILIKEIEAALTPEQANLVKLYFQLSTHEELTKEEIANRLGWKRFSKTHNRVIPDASRVKNGLDASKNILKQNPIIKTLLFESVR